jgi:hypothetical protein
LRAITKGWNVEGRYKWLEEPSHSQQEHFLCFRYWRESLRLVWNIRMLKGSKKRNSGEKKITRVKVEFVLLHWISIHLLASFRGCLIQVPLIHI